MFALPYVGQIGRSITDKNKEHMKITAYNVFNFAQHTANETTRENIEQKVLDSHNKGCVKDIRN